MEKIPTPRTVIGIMDILDRMRTGRLKVFGYLAPWFEDFRTYHRRDGRIVKEHDHALDATRAAIMALRHARTGASRNQPRSRRAIDADYPVFEPHAARPGVDRRARGTSYPIFGNS